ncbi:MAG TPA: CPBP family intramembrane glutamic endopeptidase [Thermoanaerobaculia bacterium]|nr:CPBP family intramembrane glutamic endopeptidase [Thermoanaerobaculia bacterium]
MSETVAEKLDARDFRFIAICLLVIAAGAAVTAVLFRRAFPEASIEFRVNRSQARAEAEKFLAERGHRVPGSHFAGRFDVEEEPKVYLERELGLEKASRLYGTTAKVWRWEMRWFRSGVKEEEQVTLTPLGDLVGFQFVRRDDAPGPRPPQAEARARAVEFLASRGLPESDLRLIESTPVSRPQRTDWTFVDERLGLRMGQATVRYETRVSGGEVSAFREFVHVPEAWQRDYKRLRSRNETAGVVATLGLFVTVLAMVVVLVRQIALKDVRWKLVAAFGVVGFVLSLLSAANEIPLTLFQYDTASSLSSHLTNQVLFGVLGAIAVGAGIAFVIAAAEPIYRERLPRQLSLSGLFSSRGVGTKRFFLGILLGYALVAFFFAYQAVFYVVAERFGAWAPADIPYSDMLNTAVPWVTVLLIGFLPAVSEEGISRMFSISLLGRLGAGRFLAVVVPAFLWGFGHSAYPNQPFYIRGVEVGLAGVLIGGLMLRFGVWPLLVWHFTVDAIYTALLMLRSNNGYYVVSGAVSSGILLVPLALSLLLYRRRGGFLPEVGLTNAEAGGPPPSEARPAPAEAVPPVRPLAAGGRLAGIVVAAGLALTFLIPATPASDLASDNTGKARANQLAREFLRANGVSPDEYRVVTYTGTGFAEAEEVREAKPEERGGIPPFSDAAARYVLSRGGLAGFERLASRQLPLALWVTRFFLPEKKEEWKVLVDARRARVIGFINPKEEAAPAGAPPGPEEAMRRALSAAAALGYPAAEYTVVDLGTEVRPKRRDTTVILEAQPPGVGEARPRLTAVFQGSRLSAFLPSVKVPEGFLRDYRKRSPFDWVLFGVKLVGIGSLVGVGLILFLRLVRSPDFRWQSILVPLGLVALLAAAAVANRAPAVFRKYPTEYPLKLFLITAAASLLIAWLGGLLLACGGFVLFSGARPGWVRALRRAGSLPDALLRSGVAAAGLAGISHVSALAAARFPSLFDPDPSLPASLATAVPSLAVLWSAARAAFAVSVAAAVIALAVRRPFFRRPLGAVLGLGALATAALPPHLSAFGEFLASYLPDLAALAWLCFCALFLLADHAAAWVLFGAFAFAGPLAAELLSQGAAPDRAAGWGAIALTAGAAALLIAGRRDEAPSEAPQAPPPLEPVA